MRHQQLTAIKELLKHNQFMLFPLSFVFSNFVNIFFFYIGLGFQDNIAREYGFIIFNLLFAICCVAWLFDTLRKKKFEKLQWIMLVAVMLFFLICYLVTAVRFGLQGRLLSYAEKFVVFSIPAFCAGICGGMHRSESQFFKTLESFSVLAFPAALIYFNSTLFNCLPWNYGANLGIMNYMSIAYTFMPFLLAHMVNFTQKTEQWSLPFTKKAVPHPQWIRGIMIGVYWMVIIASATRGAYVCIAGFCILLVTVLLIRKQQSTGRAFRMSALMAALVLFLMFVYAPPGLYRIERTTIFLDGLKAGQLVTSKEDPEIAEYVDDMVQMSGGNQVANKVPSESQPTTSEDISQTENQEEMATMDSGSSTEETEGSTSITENLKIENRGTYYQLALKELKKNPLTGMGPMGYTVKYGTYPHNVILEIFTELGLLAGSLVLAFIIVIVVKIFIVGRRNLKVMYLFLFFAAYAIQANISGGLWYCSALLCAIGYGISIINYKTKEVDQTV